MPEVALRCHSVTRPAFCPTPRAWSCSSGLVPRWPKLDNPEEADPCKHFQNLADPSHGSKTGFEFRSITETTGSWNDSLGDRLPYWVGVSLQCSSPPSGDAKVRRASTIPRTILHHGAGPAVLQTPESSVVPQGSLYSYEHY